MTEAERELLLAVARLLAEQSPAPENPSRHYSVLMAELHASLRKLENEIANTEQKAA